MGGRFSSMREFLESDDVDEHKSGELANINVSVSDSLDNLSEEEKLEISKKSYQDAIDSYKLSNYEDSLGHITKAAEYNPTSVDILRYKAFLLEKLGKNDEAISVYNSIGGILSTACKGLILEQKGDSKGSKECFDEVVNMTGFFDSNSLHDCIEIYKNKLLETGVSDFDDTSVVGVVEHGNIS